MKNKLLNTFLLLTSFQTMATLTDAAAVSSSQHVEVGSIDTGFMDLPDELVDFILRECSTGAQKAFRGVSQNCAKVYSAIV